MDNMIPNDDPLVTAIEMEMILPGIYLTPTTENNWTPEILRSHGFTHIIRIDKHLTQYATFNDDNANHIRPFTAHHLAATTQMSTSITYDGFEILDLDFGAASYLTTVLPNCYKAVKFIDIALLNGGAVLIIDPQSNDKSITIVVGYLMYKENLQFSKAFQLVKQIHPNLELDRFYVTQLHEYEPILQVQRTLSYGNSCSRELRSSVLKRKLSYDERQTDSGINALPSPADGGGGGDGWTENCLNLDKSSDVLME